MRLINLGNKGIVLEEATRAKNMYLFTPICQEMGMLHLPQIVREAENKENCDNYGVFRQICTGFAHGPRRRAQS